MSAALAALFVVLSIAPAFAGSRVIWYPNQNPTAEGLNSISRFTRLALGTWMRDAAGSNLSAGGFYTDLTVAPNGGMFVAVSPTTANTLGAIYQLAVDDPNPLPQGSYTPQLSSDTTKVMVQALQSGPTGSVGPITAPSSGLSQYYLVEAQVLTTDTVPIPFTFLDTHGNPSSLTLNSVRQDQIVYQLKAGTAASSPSQPTVDTGWIAIAYVLVPSGTSTITSGMISAVPAFQGFVVNGSNVTLSGLTISSLSSAGCLQNTGAGVVISLPCTSGLGSVVGTSPINASTVSGTATVSCPTCASGVSASSPLSASISSNLLTIALTGTVPFANLPSIPTSTCIGFSGTAFTSPGCLTGLTAGTGVSVGTGATPSVGLSHGDYADLASAQTIAGVKTFSSAPVMSGASISANTIGQTSVSNGYVDLSSAQTIAGVKTFSNAPVLSGASITSSTVAASSLAGGIGQTLITNGYTDLSSAQTVAGAKTFSSAPVISAATASGLTMNGQTTGASYLHIANTGGSSYIGMDSSAGTSICGSETAYSLAMCSPSTPIAFWYGSTKIAQITISGMAFQNGSSVDGNGQFISNWAFENLGATHNWQWAVGASDSSQFRYNGTTQVSWDTSGNVTATNYFTGSRREWKKNITPFRFDALDILGSTDFAEYDCKSTRCGPTGLHKVGIIANDSPAQISGKDHDHYDAFALAAIDGAAIVELHRQVLILYAIVAALSMWCIGLTIAAVRRNA